MRVLYVRLLRESEMSILSDSSGHLLMRKCFIDPVLQETTLHILSPSLWRLMGFYDKKKKGQSTFIFIALIQSLSVPFASLSASGVFQGRHGPAKRGSLGTAVQPRLLDHPLNVLSCQLKKSQDLGCQVQIDFLRVGACLAGPRSRTGRCIQTLLIH